MPLGRHLEIPELFEPDSPISPRSYSTRTFATEWQEIWEAGPYYARVAEFLEQAQSYAIFVGWQIDSRLPFPEAAPSGAHSKAPTLREKILELCERKPGFQVFFLIWDHAYFYILERETWQARIWEGLHPRLHFIFDNRHPFGGCHHEKLCLIDGEVAFCGGIDFCDERWDTPMHLHSDPRRSLDGQAETHGPYHDLALEVRGPVCAEIHQHVARRWRALSNIPFPEPNGPEPNGPEPSPTAAGKLPVYLSRTIPSLDPALAREPIVREVEFLFRDLIRSARHRIVMEGQYYWSRQINDLLIAKMHELRDTGLEINLVLAELSRTRSPTRRMAPYQMSLLARLETAARSTGTRLRMGAPYVFPGPGNPAPPKPIYVHSKVLVIDDRYLCIGSANLATRALRLDTELTLTLAGETPELRARIAEFSRKALGHWNVPGPGHRMNPNPGVSLREFRPALQRRKRMHWEIFFDPLLPWFYPGKRRFRILLRRHLPIVRALAALWLLCSALFAATLFSLLFPSGLFPPGMTSDWTWIYLGALSLAWWFPIAYLPTLLLAAWDLGQSQASSLMLAAIWSGSGFSYALSRLFPAWAADAETRSLGPSRQRVEFRDFSQLLRFLADPRSNLRTKFATQGYYCVYLPWFLLANWVILPALLDLLLRLAVAASPRAMIEFVGQVARGTTAQQRIGYGLILAAAAFLPELVQAMARRAMAGRAFQKPPNSAKRSDEASTPQDEKRNAESPLIQHPQGIQRQQQEIHPEVGARAAPEHSPGPGLPAGSSRSA